MTWCFNDKNGFLECTTKSIGQISSETRIGKYLQKLSSELKDGSSILEIGTWNGLGSTRVISDMLPFNSTFYSLETNKEKVESAEKNYVSFSNIKILHSTVLYLDIDIIEKMVLEMFPGLNREWWKIDLENMKSVPVFDLRDKYFEWVFLDGGEYTTYLEFQLLKNHTDMMILDDINTDKCKNIVFEVSSGLHNGWSVVELDPHERNGWAVIKRI
jgi:hypothetical protein